ncbi:MAG TPA: hypothetical protein VHR17_07350 [Thermoanaerobaculia bacterium]|nr:hypothetical protein [Thermoanaerobaculia bacterium]
MTTLAHPPSHPSRLAALLVSAATSVLLCSSPRAATAQRWELASADGLRLHNVSAEPATLAGKRAVRITISSEAKAVYERLQATPAPPPGGATAAAAAFLELLALVPDSELGDGTIEIDLAGEVRPGAPPGARGFIGVAFRVKPDLRTYDAFYLRPTNGRAEDQERRNHTTQYVSHPDWPWYRLRQETPGRYESYVDIQPGTWIHLKIEVAGEKARLYVDGGEQPTLVVNDVKSGPGASGQVALWIEGSTIAHFANLVVTKK